MDSTLFEQAGLNPTQAKAYTALITAGTLTPPQLATAIAITRTNAYKVLEQLQELELALPMSGARASSYRPANPAVLEKLIERRRNDIIAQEEQLRRAMPQLMTYFYTFSEQPGVRLFQGKEGLTKIYEDILRTRRTLYLIRTPAEVGTLGEKLVRNFINQRVKLGIKVEAITPYVEAANKNPATDTAEQFSRTFLPPELYDAPVEIDSYGDKVAWLSFGQELTGVIIESPQIAAAMRQLFAIMKRGAEAEFAARDDLQTSLAAARSKLNAPPPPNPT